jgi:rhamnosyltransferase
MTNIAEVAACVVLYNSPLSRLTAIETYIKQVNRLYVIDNSEGAKTDLASYLMGLPNVVYLSSGKNEGIACALNRAASQAISSGYKYLLTMDDDTAVPENMIADMLSFMGTYADADKVGILAASHSIKKAKIPNGKFYRKVLFTMTSGNLLNLTVYRQIGPFRSDFFIDHVDHDYGLRINQAKFEVIELPYLKLIHQLGERRETGWINTTYVSHSPARGYYIVRNGLLLAQQYKHIFPAFYRRMYFLLFREFIKILFFEPQKKYRLRLLYQGLLDKRAGQLGKLIEYK